MNILGIDIGGSGIKGAVVDLAKGELASERERLETPVPATPAAVARSVARIAKHFAWDGPIGVGFPGIIRTNVAHSAANLHPTWIGRDLAQLFGKATGCPVAAVNDADAAGLAEVAFGAGRGVNGTVLLLTLGTGIGSALFRDGALVPNTEFGHLEFRGGPAEDYAAASVRKARDMRWGHWSARVNRLLLHLDFLLSPDLFIIGGGVSAKFDKVAGALDKRLRVVPAALMNDAGIVGAALAGRPAQAARKRAGRV